MTEDVGVFHRIGRRAAEPSEMERWFFEESARLQGQVPAGVERAWAARESTVLPPVADAFLPPELRGPSHDQVEGRMTA